MIQPWKDTKSSSLERNELLRTVKRLGRALWKKWSGYHRRSLVETKMHCIKLLGDKLSARRFDSKHPANTALPSDPISLNLVPT